MPGSRTATVTTAQELLDATGSGAFEIVVRGNIRGMPMITLAPGVALRGGTLRFGAKGVRLTSDNTLEDVTILTADHEVAVLNDTSAEDLGRLTLRRVRTRGQVLILADDRVRTGHVAVEDLHVLSADLRGRIERPHGFGVDAMQGAITIWNRQPDPGAEVTAELIGLSAGTDETPIRGSGVFVGGHGDRDGKPDGGVLRITELRTSAVVTDGGIAEGTPDLISGGVFVITGAEVDHVVSNGPVTTFGQNDMVLDNWGRVGSWTARGPITSSGPSGIGVVNFGDLDLLDVSAPIVTAGVGARGFNLYDGTLREARLLSIATTGDGAVGVQISRPMGSLTVTDDITTNGGRGTSLVKGVQTELEAVALSVKDGGVVDSIRIGGTLSSSGRHVTTLEVEGVVHELKVRGGIESSGKDSDAVRATGEVDLAGVVVARASARAS